jgi:GH25 family lysozyme M1 (1,4-beta-N-acetylmuramidase)
MTMIRGFDVSKYQAVDQFDWAAMEADEEFQFIVARASYGKGTVDPNFVRFSEKAAEHNLYFGAYHFVRQVHSAAEQLALFERQLSSIAGLEAGADFYPVLDLEENSRYDGKPKAQLFSDIARTMAEALRAEYGNVILYYSSFFPEWFGAYRAWMVQGGYLHWLADYNKSEGQPRTPYTSHWELHQPKPRTSLFYARDKIVIDHDVLNPTTDLKTLLICPSTNQVSGDTVDGDQGTAVRPGGAHPDDNHDGPCP